MNFIRLCYSVDRSVFAGAVALAIAAAMSAPSRAAVDFVKDVQPILEMNCVSCHSGEKAEGGLDLSSRETAFKAGSDSPAIVPDKPDESALYKLTTVSKDDDTLMPPAKKGGPLDKKSIEIIRAWIAEGAKWPDGLILKTRAKKTNGDPNSDDMELVHRIHDLIVARAKSEGKFADYSAKVPKTNAPYSMIALKGGEFLMGSPAKEQGRE